MSPPSLHRFFPTVVQVSEVENAEALNRRLLLAVEEVRAARPSAKPDIWSCDLYTTIADADSLSLLRKAPFSELEPIILREAERFGRSFSMEVDKYPPRITDFWLNIFGLGHAQDVHRHPNSIISGIYYVKVPPEAGDLILHSPADDELMPPLEGSNELNALTWPWRPVAGQLLLFRSWLRHSVLPNRSSDERISIAFNICL